ncbi:hypothetical protein CRYUN_Cryun26dG0050100 [Craigia yunnanensis]
MGLLPRAGDWSFNDPELQRKNRVASYKVYTVEGKVKGSFKKSFRWLKDRNSGQRRLVCDRFVEFQCRLPRGTITVTSIH